MEETRFDTMARSLARHPQSGRGAALGGVLGGTLPC